MEQIIHKRVYDLVLDWPIRFHSLEKVNRFASKCTLASSKTSSLAVQGPWRPGSCSGPGPGQSRRTRACLIRHLKSPRTRKARPLHSAPAKAEAPPLALRTRVDQTGPLQFPSPVRITGPGRPGPAARPGRPGRGMAGRARRRRPWPRRRAAGGGGGPGRRRRARGRRRRPGGGTCAVH
jgi:hypothetical protein